MTLQEIKTLLDIQGTGRDAQLTLIISMVEKQLINKLPENMTAVPDSLDYIVTEIAIKRFNRLGSEGMTQHSQEGQTLIYDLNDFSPYAEDLAKLTDTPGEVRRGKVKFL